MESRWIVELPFVWNWHTVTVSLKYKQLRDGTDSLMSSILGATVGFHFILYYGPKVQGEILISHK